MDADAPPDWTPDADWTDKTQYYPTVLAPEPRERSRAAAEEASVAARLRHAEAAADEYLVVQLPSRLPLASNRGRGGEDALVTENKAGPTGGTHRRSETQTHSKSRVDPSPRAPRDGSDFDFSVAATLRELEEGRLGDLEVLADGSARLVIGDASFDVVEGTPFAHVEQLACVDAGRAGREVRVPRPRSGQTGVHTGRRGVASRQARVTAAATSSRAMTVRYIVLL